MIKPLCRRKVSSMRHFIFWAVIIPVVAGQVNLKTLPICAVVCVGAGVNGTGCAATNLHCICSSSSLLEIAVPCLSQNCTPADLSKTQTALDKVCLAANPAVTLPAFSSVLNKNKNATTSAHSTSSASHSSASQASQTSSVSATASSVSSGGLYSSSAPPTASGSSGLSGPAIGGIAAACTLAGIVLLTFLGGLIYRRRVRKHDEVELKNRFSDTIPFSANLRYPDVDSAPREVASARLQDDSDSAIKKHDVTRVPIAHVKPNSPEHGFRFD